MAAPAVQLSDVPGSASRLLTQSEIYEDIHSSRRPRLAPLWMSRPKKGILLGMFIEHDSSNKSKSEREDLCKSIAEAMLSQSLVRQKIKNKIIDLHVLNYWGDFARPLSESEGRAIPSCCDLHGVTIRGSDAMPMFDDVKIKDQDQSAPGTNAYWDTLIKLYELFASATSTSADDSETN